MQNNLHFLRRGGYVERKKNNQSRVRSLLNINVALVRGRAVYYRISDIDSVRMQLRSILRTQ